MQQNTCPFDVSGHPAFTVPCGKVNGLPIGMMLVGRHFEEATLIRAAKRSSGPATGRSDKFAAGRDHLYRRSFAASSLAL